MSNPNAFGNWLSNKLKERHMTAGSLSIVTNIDRKLIYAHANGTLFPYFSTLCKYANYFKVDIDSLRDLIEESIASRKRGARRMPFYCRGYTNGSPFGLWLQESIMKHQIDLADLAEEMGVSRYIIYRHMRGVTKPSVKLIRKYCEVFGDRDSWTEICLLTVRSKEVTNASLT